MISIKKIISTIPDEYKKKIPFLILLIIFTTFLEIVGLGMVIPLATLLQKKKFIFLGYEFISENILNYALIFLFLIYFFKTLFLIFFNYWKTKFIYGIHKTISTDLYYKYINQSYFFFTTRNSSDLIRNLINIDPLVKNIEATFVLIAELILVFFLLFILIFYKPIVIISMSIFILIISYLFVRYFNPLLFNLGKDSRDGTKKIIQNLNQSINNIREIKIFRKEIFFYKKFSEDTKNFSMAQRFNEFYLTLPRVLMELIAVSLVILSIYFLLYLKTENQDVIVFMALFVATGFRFLPSFVRIITSFQHLRFYTSITDNISKELKLKVENNFDQQKEIIFENQITFKNINYYFPNKSKLLINLNFNIKKKKITGFIGPTGSGKTTLINIILGLLKPISGEILIDKKIVDLNNLNWKKKIGYVPQRIYLNDETIKNCIAFGIPSEEISLDKINYALKEAQLDNYVKSLKNGIETIVGENGIQLSGGQIQRIAIARALYNKPEILILDEPTSNLDYETEEKLISSIITMKKKTTIIIVSHQDRPLKICDSIFKIDKFTINKLT